MPRLFHQPPKYRLHKSTKQAVVSFFGEVVQLGPYGSERSHKRYQELIGEWHARRHELQEQKQLTEDEKIVASITAESLRQKHKQGLRISIYELMVVYQRHADGYYRKNGKPTREAGLVREVLVPLGEKHGRDQLGDFGPVELDNFRDDLITDFDWSRKHINKQINRVIAMFKWAAKKEICKGDLFAQLKTLGGLKKGRTTARETKGVSCVPDSCVDRVLPRLPEIVADMVRFQRLTGCRPGEVCSVRPCDIDRSGDVWVYRPDAHKTEHYEKDRVVVVVTSSPRIVPY